MSKKVTVQPYYRYNDRQWKINAGESNPVYIHQLYKIIEQIHNMSAHYRRVFTLFFNLHMKSYPVNNDQVTDFLRKLKTILKSKYGVKVLVYAWCREQDHAENPHYHFMIMINGSKVHSPYNLNKIIEKLWSDITNGTVWSPDRCYYMLKRGDEETMAEIIYRASYQAKTRTKNKRDIPTKSYSTSRMKQKKMVQKEPVVTCAIEKTTTPKRHKAVTTKNKRRAPMTAIQWAALQQKYLIARARIGICVKAWCEKNNLNYNSARRSIKANVGISPLTMQIINRAQNTNNLGHDNDLVSTYDDLLQYRAALKQSLTEVYVKLILIRMQRSNLLVEINRVTNAINREITAEKSLSLQNEYLNLQSKFNNKMERIELLSNLFFRCVYKIVEVNKRIALCKAQKQANKLKLIH